jgi:gamma-glutamyl-gamma-aminobutyrate hydrolase PuuD
MSNYCLIPVAQSPSKPHIGLNSAYISFVRNNGYEPIILPATQEEDIEDITTQIGEFDPKDDVTLLLTGGCDVEPTQFGYRNLSCLHPNPLRDLLDGACLESAIEAKIPVFGICRGLQFFCISQLKGNIIWWQHIHGHAQDHARKIKNHPVETTNDFLAPFYDKNDNLFVNSMHHQAIVIPGLMDENEGYRDSSMEVNFLSILVDGFVEVIENKRQFFIVEAMRVYDRRTGDIVFGGVQWHPEELSNQQTIMRHILSEGEIEELT